MNNKTILKNQITQKSNQKHLQHSTVTVYSVYNVTIVCCKWRHLFLLKSVVILIPLEKEKVQVIVVLSEEVAQDAVWVATFDLVGRQAEVDTLYKVPELSNRVPVESPVEQKKNNNNKKKQENQWNCRELEVHTLVVRLRQLMKM